MVKDFDNSKNVLKHIHNSGCRPQSSSFFILVAAKSLVDSVMTFNKCYL